MVVILMGPMGSGKSTLGKRLAARLGWRFIEGDEYHPAGNIRKMRSGLPLEDEERWPWLDALRAEIASSLARGEHAVLACSALKEVYRMRLGVNQDTVRTVYLKGTFARLRRNLAGRQHPYMNDELLRSQLDTLEEPRDGLTVEVRGDPEDMVNRLLDELSLRT